MAKEKKKAADASELSEGGDFDMTPMIDVTFLLIIFFMCVTELADNSKSQLILPFAFNGEEIPTSDASRVVLNVKKEFADPNTYAEINLKPYGQAKLLELLQLEAQKGMQPGAEFTDKPVLIRIDREAEYGMVQRVMATCMQAKLWKLAFAYKDQQPQPK